MNYIIGQQHVLFYGRSLTSCSTLQFWLTTNKGSYCLIWQNIICYLSYHHVMVIQ